MLPVKILYLQTQKADHDLLLVELVELVTFIFFKEHLTYDKVYEVTL